MTKDAAPKGYQSVYARSHRAAQRTDNRQLLEVAAGHHPAQANLQILPQDGEETHLPLGSEYRCAAMQESKWGRQRLLSLRL